MEPKKNSFLEEVKMYCKTDYDFEDELLLELIELQPESDLFSSIANRKPEDLESHAKFRLAVKKQVKEEYEYRGCQQTPCVIH